MNIKILIVFLSAALLSSCKEKETSTHPQSPSENDTIEVVAPEKKEDTAAIDKEENKSNEKEISEKRATSYPIHFEKYPSEYFSWTKKAILDFSSNESAKYFKTRIAEAYTSDHTDFAGYYISVIFGCGASCISGFIMDVRDGKIYNLPLGEENSCLFAEERAIFNPKSRLFIAGICKESPEDTSVYYISFVWNEEKKVFDTINEKEVL